MHMQVCVYCTGYSYTVVLGIYGRPSKSTEHEVVCQRNADLADILSRPEFTSSCMLLL